MISSDIFYQKQSSHCLYQISRQSDKGDSVKRTAYYIQLCMCSCLQYVCVVVYSNTQTNLAKKTGIFLGQCCHIYTYDMINYTLRNLLLLFLCHEILVDSYFHLLKVKTVAQQKHHLNRKTGKKTGKITQQRRAPNPIRAGPHGHTPSCQCHDQCVAEDRHNCVLQAMIRHGFF